MLLFVTLAFSGLFQVTFDPIFPAPVVLGLVSQVRLTSSVNHLLHIWVIISLALGILMLAFLPLAHSTD